MDGSPSHAGFTVRRADSRDAAALGTMRAAQQLEIDGEPPPLADDAYASACASFFARELDAKDPWVVAWVAEADGRIAGSVVLTLEPTLRRSRMPPRATSRASCSERRRWAARSTNRSDSLRSPTK